MEIHIYIYPPRAIRPHEGSRVVGPLDLLNALVPDNMGHKKYRHTRSMCYVCHVSNEIGLVCNCFPAGRLPSIETKLFSESARAGPKGPRPSGSQAQGPAAPTEAMGPGRARAQIRLLFVSLGYYFRLFPYQLGREIGYFFSIHCTRNSQFLYHAEIPTIPY